MSKEKELQENFEKAIRWAAAEHYYFKELKEDLEKLKAAVEEGLTDITVSGIKAAFRATRYLAKAEKRLQLFIAHSESLAKEMQGRISKQAGVRQLQQEMEQFEEVLHRLEIEAAPLIVDASRYDGKIKGFLEHLNEAVTAKDLPQAHQIVMEISETIDDAERWLAALASDLEKAKKLSEEFGEEGHHKSIEGIQEALAPLSDEAKGEYVAYLLSHGIALKRNVRNWLEDYLRDQGMTIKGSYSARYGAEHLTLIGRSAYVAFDKYGYGLEKYTLKTDGKDASFQQLSMAVKTKNLPWIMQLLQKKNKEAPYNYAYHCLISTALKTAIKLAWKKHDENTLLELAGLILQRYRIGSVEEVIGIYLRLEKWEKAAEVYKNYYIGPSRLEKAAELYNKAGNFSKAKECWKEAARIMMNYGAEQKTISLLRKAGYTEKEAYLQCAKWSGEGKDTAKFYELAEEWALAAKAWKNIKREKQARKCLAKAEKLRLKKSKKFQNLVEQGDVYFEHGDYQKALELYEKAKAWRKVADTLNQLGRGREALLAYRKAKEAEKKERELEEDLAEIAENKRRAAQGLELA